MKIFYCFFLLFCLTVDDCHCQDSSAHVFYLDKLPSEGVLLEKGWKFHAGDNPEWARQEFDDHDWQVLNINQPIARLPQLTKNNIIWLRLRFIANVIAHDSLLALLINQYGASEVYIDGSLAQRFGRIGYSKEHINFNPHNQPIAIQLNEQPVHVIAIRFAADLSSSRLILRLADIAPISIRLQPLQPALTRMKANSGQLRTLTGVTFEYAVFGLLFLLLFLFYPRQRLNLFFGLFGLCVVLVLLITAYLTEGQYSLNQLVYLKLISNFFDRAAAMNIFLFMLLALLSRIRSWNWWYIIYFLTIDFILFNLFKEQYVYINYAVRLAFVWFCLQLFVYAFRTRKKEDWLIGMLAFLVAVRYLTGMLLLIKGVNYFRYVDIVFSLVALPSMAIYLALKYARSNTSLEQQLIQVRSLSEENTRQQQEKQQILARQNEMLEQQVIERTAKITAQKEALQNTLEELESTQAQLVQREKMASLGEMTAGIAHEIQNPLNFVNNFSDINAELVDELKSELATGNIQSAIEIAGNIRDNERKINDHGKRADAIVKNMVQHSRTGSGKEEPTDINALCEEYLRLAYHGMRAKDKSFSAKIETDFDNRIGKINIIPQDIGRVLVNLMNNAFYAAAWTSASGGREADPTVWVSTKKEGDTILISVRDNGPGIPSNIVAKIFQPFFTTKPTGQGTGLGLSLSYDIVKAHGGAIKVETKEGEGSEFIIQLPVV